MFKTAEQKQVVAQQPKPITSPQDVSQSPTAGLLPDSRGNTSSPVIVTSSSKEYQLPELPYQNEGEATIVCRHQKRQTFLFYFESLQGHEWLGYWLYLNWFTICSAFHIRLSCGDI
jgi:hypothetical protein